jgi:hypothetical protein
LARHPYLLALADEYTTTVRRLQRSFVGPDTDIPPVPVPAQDFWADYQRPDPADPGVRAFRGLVREIQAVSGLGSDPCDRSAETYQRYTEWLPFHHRRRVFIDRVTLALGYRAATAQ